MSVAMEARCPWAGADELYRRYHDEEWGVPLRDDRGLFELLMLEGMQAGLSWLVVLRKRAAMRERLLEFDPQRLARVSARTVERWLGDPALIRNRAKLTTLVGNARAFLELDERLAEFVWTFVRGAPVQNRWHTQDQVPAHTADSTAMSRALKAAGFRFVGPTVCYAFMQSAGLVNDHLTGCFRHRQLGGRSGG